MLESRFPLLALDRSLLHSSLLSLLLATALPAQIWSEEFNVSGPPNPAIWSYDLGASGWGNNELQNYTSNSSNVQVRNGHLVITARRQGNGFTSARIRSQDKLTFQYGTVEARIQVPNLQNGLWPAFWTLGNNISSVSWPDCGEIDVLEMGAAEAIGNNQVNRRVYSTAHWEFNNSHVYYGRSRVAAADLDGSFHVWRLEWTPSALTTYIDGQWIWTMDISNPSSFDGEEFHAPHFFVINLAIGGNFPGIWHSGGISAPMPAEYKVDYIRLYDNGHTILGGSSRTTPATASLRGGGLGNFNGTYGCTAPVIGSTMSVLISAGARPYQSGGVVAHVAAGNFPWGGYSILVDLTSPPVFTLPLTALNSGSASWSIPIPNDPGLAGANFATQGVLFGADIAFTNAFDLQVGF